MVVSCFFVVWLGCVVVVCCSSSGCLYFLLRLGGGGIVSVLFVFAQCVAVLLFFVLCEGGIGCLWVWVVLFFLFLVRIGCLFFSGVLFFFCCVLFAFFWCRFSFLWSFVVCWVFSGFRFVLCCFFLRSVSCVFCLFCGFGSVTLAACLLGLVFLFVVLGILRLFCLRGALGLLLFGVFSLWVCFFGSACYLGAVGLSSFFSLRRRGVALGGLLGVFFFFLWFG